ncbi:MAG: carbohydrate-binding protein [Roseibacillus sp.]
MFKLCTFVLCTILPALECAAATAQFTNPSAVSSDADGNNSAPWATDGVTAVSLQFDTSALIPAGATINSITVRTNGTAVAPSYRSEIDLTITDPSGNIASWDFGTDLIFPNSAGSWDSGNLTASGLSGDASGIFTFAFSEDYNDTGNDNSIAAVTLTVDYTSPTSTLSAPIGAYLNGIMPVTDPTNGGAQPPATLSATGAFSNLASLTVASGLVPYEVNSPLWSDGASKKRWIAIPSDGNRNSAGEQVVFNPDAPWTFPVGTVAVKHFELSTNANNPNELRRLETRFLVAIGNGDFYGVSYRWRADGSEADLLPDGASDTINITNADGSISSQTWDYPGRQDCRSCHNLGSGVFLGVNTWQLNGNITYPGGGSLQNQLEAWNDENLFTTSIQPAANYSAGVDVEDATASLEQRMRSYLAANCSNCHNPASGLNTGFDLRFSTSLPNTGLIYGSLLYDLGISGAHVITPQDPARSILYRRMDTVDVHRMPPIGRNLIHTEAVTTLNQWIMTLNTSTGGNSNPPLANDDEGLTQTGNSVAINAFANDSDVDGDSFSLLQASTPANGSTSWASNGVVTYTPANGFIGNDQFTYQISDTTGSASQAATIRVVVTAASSSNSITFSNSSNLLADPTSYSGVAMGVVDMNQDGRDDIIRLRNAKNLFVDYQNANGTFSSLSLGAPSSTNQWGLAVGDTDNNGYPDIISGGYFDGLHYQRSNSSGTSFAKSTLSSPTVFLQAVSFADINNDGWLDLFPLHDVGSNPPFRNTGNGGLVYDPSLINTATSPASDNSGNYGIVWTDYDGDGDIDMYISKCRGGVSSRTDPRRINQLFRNNGNGSFTEVAAAAGLADGAQSWTADFADIDNDGDLDCFIGNHGEASRMMRNNGNGTFTEVTSTSGISVNWNVIQSIFRDFNNDGWIDLLLTGAQQGIWMNDRDGTFTQISNPFTSSAMESAAVGDLNRDGFPDIYAGYARLYNTPQSTKPDQLFLSNNNGNGFLSVTLNGRTSNKLASGAVLELHGPWGIQMREVRSGEGYGITNSFSQRFGMGNTAIADKLVVRWPSGVVDTAFNISANQFLTLTEGDTIAPTLTNPGNRNSATESTVSLQLSANDPNRNPLTYSASNLPTGLSINSNTGRISGTTASVGGVFNVTVSVSDSWSTVSRTFTWTIEGGSNTGPNLAAIDNQVSEVNESVSLTLSANDPDGDPLSFSATGLPAGLNISSLTGIISGSANTAGTSNVTVSVTDGPLSASQSFTWTVENPVTNPGLAYGGTRPILPSLIQAEHFDTGGAGTSYYDVDSNNVGGIFRSTGVDLEDSYDADGTPNIGWAEDGEWLHYSVQLSPGTWDIVARAASEFGAPGSLRVLLDGAELGVIDIAGTGGWYNWESFVLPDITITGNNTATLRLEIQGASYNLNWIDFVAPGSVEGGGTGGGGGTASTQTPFGGIAANLPGRIQAEDFDEGPSGDAIFDLDPENIGGAYRASSVDLENSFDSDNTFSIGWIENTEWTEYTVNVTPGDYDITARIASAEVAPGLIRVLLDDRELGIITVAGTGDWYSWQDSSLQNVSVTESGAAVLRLEYIGGPYNLNWIEFSENTTGGGGEPVTQRSFLEVAPMLPGRIQAENYDLGGQGVAYQDNELANLTGAYRSDGVDIEASGDIDGSFSLGWFDANEWVEYTVVPEPGIYSVTVRTAAGEANPGDLRVSLSGAEFATFDIPDTGGPSNWSSTTLTGITLTGGGEQVLRVETVGNGINFNWIEFTRTGSLPGTAEASESRSEESLLAMAFGSWDGTPDEGEAPRLNISGEGENATYSISFLIRLGGWRTETGYLTKELTYGPQTAIDMEKWGTTLKPIGNPEGLPVPPPGYKYLTYSLVDESQTKAFFKVDIAEH